MDVSRSISQLGLRTKKDVCRLILPFHIPSIAFLVLCGAFKLLSTLLRYEKDKSGAPLLPPRRREDVELQSDIELLSTSLFNKLHANGFISQSDFMTVPRLTPLLVDQQENLSTLWHMFFPGRRRLTISEIDEESVNAFISYVSDILRGWKIPRQLPEGMLTHGKVERLYRKSIDNIWEPDPAEFENRILAWYPRNAHVFGTLLETWIDKARGNDISAIAEAISSIMNRYGSIKSLEFMDAPRLGNLIASLIRKCDSQRSVASAHAFINSMCNLVGRRRMIPVFNAVVCRLEQDEIILSFYLFYRRLEEQVLDLLSAVDRELQEIDSAELAFLDDSNIRFLRSYYHIAKYLSLHVDYWDHEIFFHLTTMAERAIGYINRLLWCSIGKEELYDWATSNMPLGFQSLLANPANMVANDAVYSEEALDRIMSTLMEQHAHSKAPGPASEEAVASLPKKNLDEKMLGPELEAECSVCMDDVTVGDEVVVLPSALTGLRHCLAQ